MYLKGFTQDILKIKEARLNRQEAQNEMLSEQSELPSTLKYQAANEEISVSQYTSCFFFSSKANTPKIARALMPIKTNQIISICPIISPLKTTKPDLPTFKKHAQKNKIKCKKAQFKAYKKRVAQMRLNEHTSNKKIEAINAHHVLAHHEKILAPEHQMI